MEAAIFGALLSSTLPTILNVIEARWNHLKGLAAAVVSIQNELQYIQGTIEKYRSSGKDICILRRVWIAQLRRLADDIQDCIDRFHGVKGTMIAGRQFAKDIDSLKGRLESIHDQLQRYITSTDDAPSSTAGEGAQGEEVHPDADDLVVVGMEGPFNELRELVLEPRAQSGRKVISIVGFGGLGKTLLADRFYNDDDVRRQFPLRAFVRAADRDAEEVHKEILKQVPENAPSTSNVAEPIGLLTSRLGNNRYLIVIDDVRTTRQWDTIMSAFPRVDGVESRIIVTTTIQSVAKHCSSRNGHVYKMRTLGDEDSRELFFRTTDPEPQDSPTPAMVLHSSAILKRCDGLPLALVSTAQFLDGNMLAGMSGCEEVCRRLNAYQEADHRLARMRQVLAHSYGSLPLVLQDCLLYFCMFPLEDPVRRNSLIRRWLAEGIVQNPHDAVENLLILMDRNIIQPIQVSNNDSVKRCRTHGMMLEYISRESMSEDFITLLSAETVKQSSYIRRLSLHPNSSAANGGLILNLPEDLSRLRTLAVFPTVNNLANHVAANLDFAKYEVLRVLDLKECAHLEGKHFEAICDLLLLKYLSFGGSIDRVPRKIGNLTRLETLDLRRGSEIVTVYAEVILLPKLKHLLGKFRLSRRDNNILRMIELQKFLSKYSRLETLSGFVIGKRKGFPQLMSHMRRLRKVKIWCKSNAGKTNLNHLKQGIKVFISEDNRMGNVAYSLSIDFQECQIPFLESVQAPGSLTSLKLRGRLTLFPHFVTQLRGIEELCLSSTTLSGDAILAGLSNLAILKYLKLVEDKLGHLVIGPGHLPSLERICLVGVQSLHDITIQDGALRRLFSLHILCEALGDLPGIQIGSHRRLKEVGLHSRVQQGTKDEWNEAARGHPNRPGILFTEGL